ncbi:hypothetical protein [uncultured Tateyamaria sp.]|uniref:hypothetical protein n=1 Tax=uncultured Tateyamaria sp. TaxID=455651 RepID=UPI0026245F6C|nr:hypothetical protein [uncultured Tateyamaria sp.]
MNQSHCTGLHRASGGIRITVPGMSCMTGMTGMARVPRVSCMASVARMTGVKWPE